MTAKKFKMPDFEVGDFFYDRSDNGYWLAIDYRDLLTVKDRMVLRKTISTEKEFKALRPYMESSVEEICEIWRITFAELDMISFQFIYADRIPALVVGNYTQPKSEFEEDDDA